MEAKIRAVEDDAICRREDVINLYNLLLRRDPENESVITPRLRHTVWDIFAEIVRSSEFHATVLQPLASGTFVPAVYRGSGRLDDLVDWATRRLPMSTETRERLDTADSWTDVYVSLAQEPALVRLVPKLQETQIRVEIERKWRTREAGLNIDNLLVSPSGYVYLSGWLKSAAEFDPITEISFYRNAEPIGSTSNVARCRPIEAEQGRLTPGASVTGFWTIFPLNRSMEIGEGLEVVVTAGQERRCAVRAVGVANPPLRDIVLDRFADSAYRNDATAEAFFELDNGNGQAIIDLNCEIVTRIVEGAYQMQFGARRTSYEGTIIVCLYGKPEFLTLQAALFSQYQGYDRYEFVYVSNSPELADKLVNDAAIASVIYGVAIKLILLPGNAGFAAANNAAAAAAGTRRLLFVNPDALPRDPQWVQRLGELLRSLPSEQTKLFGVSLYYDDESLMHGGMYIDVDGGFVIRDGKMTRRDILRIEHYGKGLSAQGGTYQRSRPVPAVTGALLAVDRAWFEKLSGFSQNYIFGHYEDVDFCLRSLQAGQPAWMHDLPFWHLESKGSTAARAQLGARVVNRWLLTSSWAEFVKEGLSGQRPSRLFR